MLNLKSIEDLSKILSKPSVPLCVFIGSGISSACSSPSGLKPPSWEDLVVKLQNHLNLPKSTGASLPLRLEELLFDLREDPDRSSAALDAIRSWVNGKPGDLVTPGKVHQELVYLNPDIIITTNFDDLIERALLSESEDAQGYNVWAYPNRLLRTANQMDADHPDWDDITLGDLLKSDIPLIAKIHGSLGHDPDDPNSAKDQLDTLVLAESGYRTAYDQSEISPFLRAVFSTHQVMFIGYSLNDEEIRRVMSDLNTIRSSNVPHIFVQRGEAVVSEKLVNYYRSNYGLAVVTLDDWDKLADSIRLMALIRSGDPGPLFGVLGA